jgi:hypothetical protein
LRVRKDFTEVGFVAETRISEGYEFRQSIAEPQRVMFPFFLVMLLLLAGLVALGFYFHFRRGMSVMTIIRMYLTRVFTIFALVFFLIGIYAPFHADSIKDIRWSFVVVNVALGVSLGYCALRLSPNK